jgi:hypothetical protein
LFEDTPARHVSAREDPRHDETDDECHQCRRERHHQRIEHDLRVVKQGSEVIETISGRRSRLRITDVERRLQKVEYRVQDQHRGNGGDPEPGDSWREQ